MDEQDLARLQYIGIVVLANGLLLAAVLGLAAWRGWRPAWRRIVSLRDPFWGILACAGSWAFVGFVVFPPIGETILLVHYFSAEEIERENLHVVEIVGKQEVVFSNGERRPYESSARYQCAAAGFGIWIATIAVVLGVLALSGNELVGRIRSQPQADAQVPA